jgi:hypothetical protein
VLAQKGYSAYGCSVGGISCRSTSRFYGLTASQIEARIV